MINGIRVKVCGLTSLADAKAAVESGADDLGFIFYPKSPRYVSREHYQSLEAGLPAARRVAVLVEPTVEALAAHVALGFDGYQIHFNPQLPLATIAAWAQLVGDDRLWLAPRLAPGVEVSPELLPLADTFLMDTFHADKLGGTGETGDWEKFRRHRDAHATKHWILSGGLTPANAAAAIRASGTRWIDVNSGVEQAPGVKDRAKLAALATALKAL